MSESDRIPADWLEWWEERAAMLEGTTAGYLATLLNRKRRLACKRMSPPGPKGRLMVSECEHVFRESLAALIDDRTVMLPPGLRAALTEHLTRRDGQGYSLCFANPERERLLTELTPVLLGHLTFQKGTH